MKSRQKQFKVKRKVHRTPHSTAQVKSRPKQLKVNRKVHCTPHPTMFSDACRFSCGSKRKLTLIMADDIILPPSKRATAPVGPMSFLQGVT